MIEIVSFPLFPSRPLCRAWAFQGLAEPGRRSLSPSSSRRDHIGVVAPAMMTGSEKARGKRGFRKGHTSQHRPPMSSRRRRPFHPSIAPPCRVSCKVAWVYSWSPSGARKGLTSPRRKFGLTLPQNLCANGHRRAVKGGGGVGKPFHPSLALIIAENKQDALRRLSPWRRCGNRQSCRRRFHDHDLESPDGAEVANMDGISRYRGLRLAFPRAFFAGRSLRGSLACPSYRTRFGKDCHVW